MSQGQGPTVAVVARQNPQRVASKVGLRVAELRVRKGETQDDLAARLGLSLKYVQRVERGTNLTIRSLVTFANAFGVETGALFEPPSFTRVGPGLPTGKRRARAAKKRRRKER